MPNTETIIMQGCSKHGELGRQDFIADSASYAICLLCLWNDYLPTLPPEKRRPFRARLK
jgi:hypothetical protein